MSERVVYTTAEDARISRAVVAAERLSRDMRPFPYVRRIFDDSAGVVSFSCCVIKEALPDDNFAGEHLIDQSFGAQTGANFASLTWFPAVGTYGQPGHEPPYYKVEVVTSAFSESMVGTSMKVHLHGNSAGPVYYTGEIIAFVSDTEVHIDGPTSFSILQAGTADAIDGLVHDADNLFVADFEGMRFRGDVEGMPPAWLVDSWVQDTSTPPDHYCQLYDAGANMAGADYQIDDSIIRGAYVEFGEGARGDEVWIVIEPEEALTIVSSSRLILLFTAGGLATSHPDNEGAVTPDFAIIPYFSTERLPDVSVLTWNGVGVDVDGTGTGRQWAGLVTEGNLDINHRPHHVCPDGSIATVRSMSFEEDGNEVLVPTVAEDGHLMTNAEAIEQYQTTGNHLGIFDNAIDCDAYARALHLQQEWLLSIEAGSLPALYILDSQVTATEDVFQPEMVGMAFTSSTIAAGTITAWLDARHVTIDDDTEFTAEDFNVQGTDDAGDWKDNLIPAATHPAQIHTVQSGIAKAGQDNDFEWGDDAKLLPVSHDAHWLAPESDVQAIVIRVSNLLGFSGLVSGTAEVDFLVDESFYVPASPGE